MQRSSAATMPSESIKCPARRVFDAHTGDGRCPGRDSRDLLGGRHVNDQKRMSVARTIALAAQNLLE